MSTSNVNTYHSPHEDILVVENNPPDLKLLSDILKKAGYRVRPASDGELALRSVRAKLPAMILLDVEMPGMSGLEACHRLKADPRTRDLPVVFISVLGETSAKVQAFEAGGVDYVTKPFESSEVLARISTHLNMHRLQRGLETQSKELLAEIEERKRAEERIEHLNLILRAIAKVNELVSKESDCASSVQGVCDCLIEARGYHTAWISLLDDSGEIFITAEAGPGSESSSLLEHLKQGKLPRCGEKALKQAEVVVVEDPHATCVDCPFAEKHAGRALMVVRLEHGKQVRGILAVSVPKAFAKDEQEQALIRRIARHIALALDDMESAEQRKRAEQALRESEEQYRRMFDFQADGVLVIHLDGTIAAANPAACAMYGYSSDEFSGLGIKDRDLIQSDYHVLLASAGETVGAGRSFAAEFVALRRGWSAFHVETRFSPYQRNGKPHVLAVVRDITERKQEKDRARKWREELTHALRLNTMGEMVAGIAHELNQPLSAIANYAETCSLAIQGGKAGKEKLVDKLENVVGQAQRAGEIIRHLRSFVRKQEPHRSSVDVNDAVQEVIHFVESEARLSEVQVQLRLAAEIPMVMADSIEIQQVVLNLVRNALEAMNESQDGERVLTIQTSSAASGAVEVAVSDTGPGTSAETMDRLFEPFHTTKPEGLGLGLTISQSIIEAHGGRLTATANPDRGMTLRFTLPAGNGDQNDEV